LPQPGTTERPQFRFEPMSQRQARAIAAWRYDPPYDFYDAVADPEDLAELLDPVQRESRYFAVLGDPGGLVGFSCSSTRGHRRGRAGTAAGLDWQRARALLPARGSGVRARAVRAARFRLTVAAFNQRAIHVYERAGFRRGESYTHRTNGGEHPLLRMERSA
jgi:[ribosomal protein S18]-alanine N-acetyltransferase